MDAGRITEVGQVAGRRHPDHRRRRPAGHPGLGRRAHALRRPGHVGLRARPVVVARRHHARDGQLRRRLRAGRSPTATTGSSASWRASRTSPARRWPRGSSGSGRPSPSISTRWSGGAGPSTSAPRSPTAPCGPTSWASGAPATSRRGPRTSRPCGPSCSRRCGPGRSGSRPRARSGTAPSTASWCRAPTPPRTSCSASGPRWARPAPASSSWRRWARRARCSTTRSRRSTGCAGSRPPSGRPVSYVLLQQDDDPELWRTAAGRLARRLRRGGAAVPPDRRATDRDPLGPPHDAVPLRRLPGLPGAARPAGCRPRSWRRALADPEVRRAIVAWTPSSPAEAEAMEKAYHRTFVLGDPPDYEPGPGALAGGPRRGTRDDAAGGGLRRDGPRRRARGCSTSRSSTTPRATSTTCAT